MNRRETLKALGLTSLSASLFLEACETNTKKPTTPVSKDNVDIQDGRQPFEVERLQKLNSEPPFFTEQEMLTITALADIIIPKDDVSGSASDAKVPEFIAFIVKDMPQHQIPMRGGLKWLDRKCLSRYGNAFTDCKAEQQLDMVEQIAYPLKATPEMQPGVAFFNRMRSLTTSGFYTTKIGIDDLGYVGNKPNKWEGVPKDVLAQYGLES